jgi:preprotein translocase subunit Sec61beta
MMVASLFVAAGLLYFWNREAAEAVHISRLDWLLTAASAVIIFFAFVANHAAISAGGAPGRFPWEIFTPGLALALLLLVKTGVASRARV